MTEKCAGDPDGTGSWWTISGETTGERIRDGFPQLLVLVVMVWIGTIVVYDLLSTVVGPLPAAAVVLGGAVFVAFDLRDRMVVDAGGEVSDEAPRDENGDTDDASGATDSIEGAATDRKS